MTAVDAPYDHPFEGSPARRGRYEYHLARDCILPLLARWGVEVRAARVLDLGCGSGGLAVAMAEGGADCCGVDLRPERIAQASEMAADHGVRLELRAGDVLAMDDFEEPFDLVVLSEVVEHLENVANVATLLGWCRGHLAPAGHVYVSFPPWFGPFAGHQAGWPRIRYVPWYHLLPVPVKRLVAGERGPAYFEFARELNHLTVGAFERIVREARLAAVRRELYLVRPEFHQRYGLPALRSALLGHVPLLREVSIMGAYYLLAGGGGR